MTDISLKNRIIALVAFSFTATILTLRNVEPFAFVFFGCMGIVIFFADRILNSEKIKNRTVFAFFVFAAVYQTFFQIFYRAHETNSQLMISSAAALFIAGAFAATDIKNLPYSILAAPVICFLDIRIAASYCLLLLTFSIVRFQLELKGNKSVKKQSKKKNSKKKSKDAKAENTVDPFFVVIISIIVSIVCLGFCVYAVLKNEVLMKENFSYVLQIFKNFFGFSIFIIYLFIKLLKSSIKAKAAIIAGFILNLAPVYLYFINYGWCFVSLFLVSTALFLPLVCLESEDVIESFREDYHSKKYIFFTGLLLLLQ